MKINEATSTDLKVIKELEKKTGRRIVSGKNFLIAKRNKKNLKKINY